MSILFVIFGLLCLIAFGRELLLATVTGLLVFGPCALLLLWVDGYFDHPRHSFTALGLEGCIFYSVPLTCLVVCIALKVLNRKPVCMTDASSTN